MRRIENASDEIVLRPRFQMELPMPNPSVLAAFEISKREPFSVHRVDDHVFIKFSAAETHFWSPQLHLEINEVDDNNSKLFGVFGPNPTLWTFFMFLHFGVATLFVILGIWAYSHAALHLSYGIQVGFMVRTVVVWFVLYAFGRAGRQKGKTQMHELHKFMIATLYP